jgi:hypothetical protein
MDMVFEVSIVPVLFLQHCWEGELPGKRWFIVL